MPLILILLLLAWLATLLGDLWWPLDMARHFPVQLALVALLTVIPSLLLGRRRFAGMLVGAAALHVWPALPDLLGEAPEAGEGAALRLMLANVRTENRDYAQFHSLVAAHRPDVLVAVEVDSAWVEAIRGEGWAQTVEGPGPLHFGIAVFTRQAVAGSEVFVLDRVPAIRVRLESPEADLTAVHTYRQADGGIAARQAEQFRVLAGRMREAGPHAILAGDLNATPWCAGFGRLLRLSGLQDAREGFGLGGTWPAKLPDGFRIPIDHVLVSGDIGVRARAVSPAFGSDHRAVITDLVLR